MKKIIIVISIIFIQIVIGQKTLYAQFNNLEYADSTQIIIVFDNEQDTAAINELKHELQATELATTPFTRIHLWQIPLDTIAAYGGVSQILNHALAKPRIKGGSSNYSVPLIFNIDDNDDDPDIPQAPLCYNDSLFDCAADSTPVTMGFLDTGFDGEPSGNKSIWMPSHIVFKNRPMQNAGEAGKSLNNDNDKNGFMDDVKGWDFHYNDNLPLDDNGHGSHTAGLAALKHIDNNDANRNKIMMLKTHNQAGEASMWQLMQALDYALRYNVKIVNMSLAYLSPVNPSGKPTVMEFIMDFGKTYKGTLFVAAAGNDSINIDQPLILNNGMAVKYCPAALPNDNLIVVAAGTCNNELASFSNFGPVSVDIAAPGIEIYSALLDGTYGYLTGTSMAAPHVTAAAALAATKQTVFNWKQIKHDLLNRSTASAALSNYVSSGRMLTFCDNYSPSTNTLLVTAKANKVLCIGGNVILSATATGGQSPYSYAWSNGSSGSNCTINIAGVYTVTVTDASGNTASETLNVYGASAPLAQTALQPVSCGDNCTVLEITNKVAGASYLWNNGLKTSSINVCPDIDNTYSVTTTTPNGCSSLTQITLQSLNITLQPLNDTNICPCTPTVLKAIAQGGVGQLNYLWSPGNITTPEISVSLANGSVAYSVLVSDSRGCTASASAMVTAKCIAPVAVSAIYNSQNQKTTFNWLKSPCNINRWQLRWRCSSAASWNTVTINDTSVNSYSVTLPLGCAPQWQVRSRCCNNVYSSWSLLPELRQTSQETKIVDASNTLVVFPNPAGTFINLSRGGSLSESQAFIYDSQGKLLLNHHIQNDLKTTTIDISKLNPGLYFLRCGEHNRSFSKQ